MASPFAVFRRNQKIMLATVGIGAMVAFVFLDPVMRYLGGPAKQENPVVVETNYGNLTRDELDNLEFSREIVNTFLQRVTAQVVSSQVGQGNVDPRLLDSLVERQYRFWYQRLLERSQPGRGAAAVETLVLSQRATQLGMVISDQAINDLLKEITADSVSSEELEGLIRALQPTRPVSVVRLFESLRTEMLAAEYMRLFIQSLRDVPPAQRFEYYARLNRRANAEVMALAVADFVGQVADPSNEEVKQIYEKHKNDYPNPDSPEPGFEQPPRASLQYFKADVDQLAEKIKPEITEEQIKKYYEDNKAQFRAFDMDEDPTKKPGEDEAKPDADQDKSEKSPDETQPKQDAAEEKPEAKTDEPTSEKPAEDKPAEPKADEKPAESAPQAARMPKRPIMRLASATLADADPPGDEQPAPSPEKSAAEPAQSTPPADKADTAKAEKADADQKPADEQPAPKDEPADAEAAKKADAEPSKDAPSEEPPAEEPRFEPLEKVRDTIRDSLAMQKATQRIGEQFEELSAAMRRYADDLDLYNTEKATNPKAQAPAPLDFAKLAEGKNVQPEKLQSVNAAEAAKTDIGKTFRVVQNARTRTVNTVPFVDFALSETLPLYKSETVQDNDNNAYLVWKTQEEPAFVPPLDQVRDQVVRAWKMIKARDLARKRAEEYAVQARALQKPLKELFGSQANLQIAETGPFSWLTLGNVPSDPGAQPRLSEVPGVDRPAAEFMKTVFGLEPAGIGVAANEPQDLVYVVRLIDFTPPMEELRDAFARENPNRYLVAGNEERRAIFQAWLSDLNEQAGVHWVRQADARDQADEEAAF